MAKAQKETALSPEERLQNALVPNWNYIHKIPKNWCWTYFKSAITLLNGDRGVNYPSKQDYVASGIPFINAGAIDDGKLNREEFNYISKQKYDSLNAGKVQQNDVLYCLRGSLGKCAIVDFDEEGAISSSLCIMRPKEIVQTKYLFYYLNCDTVVRQQNEVENGSAQPNLSAASVLQYNIPISPLAEQKRIVDQIEDIFAKLDEAKEQARAVVDSFETRKAAILHKAFAGELTGNKCGTWKKTCLKNVVSGFKYGTSEKSDYENEGMPVLRIPNIGDGVIDFDDMKKLAHSDVDQESQIHPNDILIIRSNGSRELVGKCAIVPELSEPYAYASFLIRIKPSDRIDAQYLVMYLNSSDARAQMFRKAKSSAGINNINSQELGAITLAVPSLPEQREIVRILDSLLSKEQQAHDAALAVIDRIDAMKKAVLAKAFRGELGTNDPADEPAIELLKRVLDIPAEPKAPVKRTRIPSDLAERIKTDMERKIIKLYIQNDTDTMTMSQLMTVSSKKFDIMNALGDLQRRGVLSKQGNQFILLE